MKKFFLIISLITFPLIGYADRDDYDHDREDHGYYWNKVNRRLERQCDRIENGIINGSLNRREAKILQREQRRINRRIDRLSYQYRVSNYDRRKIMHRLDEASENIYRLKHNDHYAHNRYYQPSNAYQQNITRLGSDFIRFYLRY